MPSSPQPVPEMATPTQTTHPQTTHPPLTQSSTAYAFRPAPQPEYCAILAPSLNTQPPRTTPRNPVTHVHCPFHLPRGRSASQPVPPSRSQFATKEPATSSASPQNTFHPFSLSLRQLAQFRHLVADEIRNLVAHGIRPELLSVDELADHISNALLCRGNMGNANTSECDGNIDTSEHEVNVDTSEREVKVDTSEREVNVDTSERNVNDHTSESAGNAHTSESGGNVNPSENAGNANASESEADRAFDDLCLAYQHMDRLRKSNPQLSTYPNLEGLFPPMWLRVVGFAQKELSGVEKRTYRMACHYFALGHYVDMFNKSAAKLKELGELEKRLNGRSKFPHIGPLCEHLPTLHIPNTLQVKRRHRRSVRRTKLTSRQAQSAPSTIRPLTASWSTRPSWARTENATSRTLASRAPAARTTRRGSRSRPSHGPRPRRERERSAAIERPSTCGCDQSQ